MSRFRPTPELEEQLQTLPLLPGVYIMKDKDGEIIYVGKSKSLRNRVRSYFRGFDKHPPKTQTMVVNIQEFEYILTDTEAEALILEANLIKKHRPRFNIQLKDDKMYPFVVVTNEDFPRIFMTRTPHQYDGKIYGPFTSSEAVKTSLEILHSVYKVRECKKTVGLKPLAPCLYYHMGRCLAPCTMKVSIDEYRAEVEPFVAVFKGEKSEILATLEKQMYEAAEKTDFETAAIKRDEMLAVESIREKQKIMQNKDTYQDYISAAILGDKACVMVFFVRSGKLEHREVFSMIGAEYSSLSDVISAFLPQFYGGSLEIPKEIYISHPIENMESYAEMLSHLAERKVHLAVPQKGEKKKTVLLLEKNAMEYVEKFQKRMEREYEHTALAQAQLRTLLGLPEETDVSRWEAFDISNTSGIDSVGSMVVFENGRKKRSDYRRYRIKTIEGSNDYASMQEILYRRYRPREEATQPHMLPGVIFVDGGKGHVSAAETVLHALGLKIPVVGMVKDDFHKTEDLVYRGERLGLKRAKNLYKLIYRIQEEVHRFAVEYHKTLRDANLLRSELDEIPGIGEKRKIALLKRFQTVEKVKTASERELGEVLPRAAAERVYRFFHSAPLPPRISPTSSPPPIPMHRSTLSLPDPHNPTKNE